VPDARRKRKPREEKDVQSHHGRGAKTKFQRGITKNQTGGFSTDAPNWQRGQWRPLSQCKPGQFRKVKLRDGGKVTHRTALRRSKVGSIFETRRGGNVPLLLENLTGDTSETPSSLINPFRRQEGKGIIKRSPPQKKNPRKKKKKRGMGTNGREDDGCKPRGS